MQKQKNFELRPDLDSYRNRDRTSIFAKHNFKNKQNAKTSTHQCFGQIQLN